jgi:uncharacterized membrane protein YjgN (DUF898 family)
MTDTVATQVGPAITETPVALAGQRADFLRLLMRGATLELFTVGFYRFWLNTDMRRHLWSHSSAGGDVLEYVGTAKELLIGFLFALAILVPVYLIYFFIGLEAERWQAFASIPLVIFFYLFAQFAVFRARRYRLTRTIWRGVRFWMTGSGWAYAWRAGLWALRCSRSASREIEQSADAFAIETMNKLGRGNTGPELLSADEWRALKAVCGKK